MEARRLGALEAWKLGGMEAWELGRLDAWKLGAACLGEASKYLMCASLLDTLLSLQSVCARSHAQIFFGVQNRLSCTHSCFAMRFGRVVIAFR